MSLILGGALTSLSLTIAAGITGFMVAFLLALLRFKKVPVLDRIAASYIDFIRNTPLIVQLFFIAFGLPMLFGYVWPFWCHALLALTINFSGYFAEILRSGFASTQKGQLEAAAALNLRNKTVFGSILGLPQPSPWCCLPLPILQRCGAAPSSPSPGGSGRPATH